MPTIDISEHTKKKLKNLKNAKDFKSYDAVVRNALSQEESESSLTSVMEPIITTTIRMILENAENDETRLEVLKWTKDLMQVILKSKHSQQLNTNVSKTLAESGDLFTKLDKELKVLEEK